jgi:hypothetical protein
MPPEHAAPSPAVRGTTICIRRSTTKTSRGTDDRARATGDDRLSMSARRLLDQLHLLHLELACARESGLIASERYRRDLEAEMAHCRTAFVGAAVTEIAVLRAQLWGRQLG